MRSPEPASSASDEFVVLLERVGGALVLAVAGEVDMITAPTLQRRIAAACTEAPALIVIDLTEVRDHTIRLWDLNPTQDIERICNTTAQNLTPQQWATYIPELPYDPPCR